MASPQCYYCNSPVGDSARFCPSCSQPLLLQGKYRILRLLGQGGYAPTLADALPGRQAWQRKVGVGL